MLDEELHTKCTKADKALAIKRAKEEGFEKTSPFIRALIRKGKLNK